MLHDQPDFLFRQTPAQLRRMGARGGRACARNRRARVRAATAPPPKAAVTPPARLPETAAEAIATLDLQFPWLRGAEHGLCPWHQYGSLPHSPMERTGQSESNGFVRARLEAHAGVGRGI